MKKRKSKFYKAMKVLKNECKKISNDTCIKNTCPYSHLCKQLFSNTPADFILED